MKNIDELYNSIKDGFSLGYMNKLEIPDNGLYDLFYPKGWEPICFIGHVDGLTHWLFYHWKNTYLRWLILFNDKLKTQIISITEKRFDFYNVNDLNTLPGLNIVEKINLVKSINKLPIKLSTKSFFSIHSCHSKTRIISSDIYDIVAHRFLSKPEIIVPGIFHLLENWEDVLLTEEDLERNSYLFKDIDLKIIKSHIRKNYRDILDFI
jgi:hypothetical protein